MWPILLLAGGAFVAYELFLKNGSSQLTAAQAQANQGLVAANASLSSATAPTAPYDPSNPATYGGPGTPSSAVPPDWPSTPAPGTPAGTTTAGAPLYHTGHRHVTGAPIAVDAHGNPYLCG